MENEFQGGKAFGFLKSQQEEKLNSVNEMFLTDSKYDDVADLPCKLESFKQKYMEFDLNDKGEIDTMGLKRMLEKLGMAKTHLELMKIMRDIGGSEGDDSISYSDFLQMMLGKRNAILKLILMYEMKAKGNEDPKESGPPPPRALSELP